MERQYNLNNNEKYKAQKAWVYLALQIEVLNIKQTK